MKGSKTMLEKLTSKTKEKNKEWKILKLFKRHATVDSLIETMNEEDYFNRTSDSFGKLVLKRFLHNTLGMIGLAVLLIFILASALAPIICPYDYEESHLEELTTGKPLPPNEKFIWGTDALGRDYFTRCLYGGRISLLIGFAATAMMVLIGVPLGIISGYFGGWVDTLLQRLLEIFNSIPTFLIMVIISAGLERSMWNVIWVMGVFYWPSFVRIIRAYFLSLKGQDYVQAAKALGIHPFKIIMRHMFPAVTMPLLIVVSTSIVSAIMAETSLSYLGFGILEPTPTWGSMLNASTRFLRWVPTMALFPGMLISLVTLSLNFIADGLRDAFDPRSMQS